MPLAELAKGRAFKERLAAGHGVIGVQLELADPAVVEIVADAGFDCAVIDADHSAYSPETIRSFLQTAAATRMVVIVRPGRLDADIIRLYLDLGAQGILSPFLGSAADAELLVAACRYPPLGRRGFGPRRATRYGTASREYFEGANDSIVVLGIVESRAAVDRIDEILATDGLDGVIVGGMDLSVDLGAFADFRHPDFVEALARVRSSARAHGKAVGGAFYSPEEAISRAREGDQLLIAPCDDQMLAAESRRVVEFFREVAPAG